MRAGQEGFVRPEHVVSRLPQAGSILRIGCPLKRTGGEFPRDLAETLRLFRDACLGAVKFEEQHRRFGQAELRVLIAGANLDLVEQLDPGNRNARLNRRYRCVAGRLD